MNFKQIAKDTAKTLISYLTYQAVRTVIAQLSETNPPLALWLSQFSSKDRIQDGEAYIQDLLREKQDLAFRIMTVREHIAQEVADFLPEMVRTGIQQTNMEHRRQHLERITQMEFSGDAPERSGIPEALPRDPSEEIEPDEPSGRD
ncbi:MAG: chaperonin family protein RbcX [Leptolyngbyaceae cyanobacterium bins.59]|nr:chaperonin family protein RbcX [Leptolyngbyaceae cyanobacterium bins.59]